MYKTPKGADYDDCHCRTGTLTVAAKRRAVIGIPGEETVILLMIRHVATVVLRDA